MIQHSEILNHVHYKGFAEDQKEWKNLNNGVKLDVDDFDAEWGG